MCSQGNTGNGHRKKQQRQKNRYPTFPLESLLHTTEPAPMQFNMNRRKQKKKESRTIHAVQANLSTRGIHVRQRGAAAR